MYLIITTVADVSESIPERVTASPYDGIRKGSAVIMNMPKPKPTVLWTKLAPAERSIMYSKFSVIAPAIHSHSPIVSALKINAYKDRYFGIIDIKVLQPV
jgi:hypothetical protein